MSADSSLKTRIDAASKDALRSGNRERLGALRLILAAIKQVEVDSRKLVEDQDVLLILDKLGKQRRESIEQFTAAGRKELAAKERQELEIIGEFLPPPLTDSEITTLIDEALTLAHADSIKDMGKVMNLLRPKLQGRADMSEVSSRIKARLAS